ncbi:MAG: NAD-binding protein [Erysipelotrichaceae bacterium]|nr:NAD-binding protein [Erysipelotrichaceae bacterium]MDP3305519.1 NAD-binding protein [Erysipelotrichaceae bacterium]
MYVIIVGCELLGSRIAKEMANLNNDVVVIERSESKLETLTGDFNGMILHGIEFDQDNLVQAGIEKADVILALTDDDNINITVSLVASKVFNVKRVISQVIDPSRRYLYELLDIESFCPTNMGVNSLLSKLDINQVDQLAQISSGIELTRIVVERNISISVREVYVQTNALISILIHNGISSICKEDTIVTKGDMIVCSNHLRDRKKLTELLVQED